MPDPARHRALGRDAMPRGASFHSRESGSSWVKFCRRHYPPPCESESHRVSAWEGLAGIWHGWIRKERVEPLDRNDRRRIPFLFPSNRLRPFPWAERKLLHDPTQPVLCPTPCWVPIV